MTKLVEYARSLYSFTELTQVLERVQKRCRSFTAIAVLIIHPCWSEYQAHYNTAWPHQGIAQRVPDGEVNGGRLAVADLGRERIYRKPVLGGLINEYSLAA
jgi:hypothetical protein